MIPLGERATTDVACTQVTKGDVWNGFEWVSPARYEQQRATTMPDLPPIQPVLGELSPGLYRDTVRNVDIEVPPPPTKTYEHVSKLNVIEGLLGQIIGEDPSRGGLLETPARVVKAWEHWCNGYSKSAADILKVFEDGAEGCDEMVVVRNIPIYSHCEHHLAPIFGHATIAYLPDGKIVGLSKLNRLADMFARRLQVQERMTNQIADALMEHLQPRGCGVVVNARHMCMESRGVQQSSNTVTSALRGAFKEDPAMRAEFLKLAHG